MERKEKQEWARHYDALFWTVATIMSAAIGGLLLFLISYKFDSILAFVAITLIVLTVYFAASFRELRFMFQNIENDDMKKFADKREFIQWWPYLSIFLLLCLIWVNLLWNNAPEGWIYWLIIGVINFIFIIFLGVRTDASNLKKRLEKIRKKSEVSNLKVHLWLIVIIGIEFFLILDFKFKWLEYTVSILKK